MNSGSHHLTEFDPADRADNPILIVPYMWIGDFVRVHSVIRLLKQRWPNRPIDLLTSSLCAPILDYLPGVRRGIVADLPRRRLPLSQYSGLAKRIAQERYGTALIMPRTWKAALAPFLAGIPERTGFAGEFRVLLVNDMRFGERKLERKGLVTGFQKLAKLSEGKSSSNSLLSSHPPSTDRAAAMQKRLDSGK